MKRSMTNEQATSVANLKEFEVFVKKFAETVSAKGLVLLNGPLGVGKTQWVRTMVAGLGGQYVSSPTFAIIQRYQCKSTSVDHVDLYRLKDEWDLESTGFWDLFSQDSGLIIVEWAGRVPFEIWPIDWPIWQVELDFEGVSGRRILVREWSGSPK